ncbi:MAG: hypothetical protein Q4C95_10705, partial [Planctomycetia bacterium]|nr:hypothetical protein [Planctomycetia bacterium]
SVSNENNNEPTETSVSNENNNEPMEYSDSPGEDDLWPSVWLEEANHFVCNPFKKSYIHGFQTEDINKVKEFTVDSMDSISPDDNEANAAQYGLITVAFYNERSSERGLSRNRRTKEGQERDVFYKTEPFSSEEEPCAIFHIRCAGLDSINAYRNDPDYLGNESNEDSDTATRSANTRSANATDSSVNFSKPTKLNENEQLRGTLR